jgi:hypothetical protein
VLADKEEARRRNAAVSDCLALCLAAAMAGARRRGDPWVASTSEGSISKRVSLIHGGGLRSSARSLNAFACSCPCCCAVSLTYDANDARTYGSEISRNLDLQTCDFFQRCNELITLCVRCAPVSCSWLVSCRCVRFQARSCQHYTAAPQPGTNIVLTRPSRSRQPSQSPIMTP